MASNSQSQPLDLSTDPQRPDSRSFGPDLSSRNSSGRFLKRVSVILLIATVVAGGVYAFPSLKAKFFAPKLAVENFVTKPAVKGPFQIKVVAKGTVDSSKNSSLVSNVEGTTTIISIVPAGTLVRDPLRSEVSGYVESIRDDSSGKTVIAVREGPQKKKKSVASFLSPEPVVSQEQKPGEVRIHTYERGELTAVVVEAPRQIETLTKGDEDEDIIKTEKGTYLKTIPGTYVSAGDILAGDLVCVLDAAPLVDQEKQQQIAVEQGKADLEKAVKNVEIQILQNDTDVSGAELEETLAKLDLMKYIGSIDDLRAYLGDEINKREWESVKASLEELELKEKQKLKERGELPATADKNESKSGEFKQAVDKVEGELKQSAAELKQAIAKLEYVERLANKGYKTPEEVNTEKLTVSEKELALKVKQTELDVLTKFTLRRTLTELLANLKETGRHVGRIKLAGEAALAQFRAEVTAAELAHTVQNTKLEELRRQISACRLIAPQTGRVVYANENSRGREPVNIEEGISVRERQKLINLPDMNAMKVDARIHESKISNVVAGLPVQIRVDAIPNHVFAGKLDAVSAVPLPGNWMNSDLKEYEANVRISDVGEMLKELKPGMTANIDIIVENSSENLLQIPVQSTVRIGKEYYVWVLNSQGQPEKRKPKLGRSNDVDFVVENGIDEGELVVMNPLTRFADEIKELNDKADNADLKKQPKVENPGPQNVGESTQDLTSGGAGPQQPGAGAPPRGSGDPTAFFQQMDKNGDGKLSDDEMSDRMKERFANADTDQDGSISLEEFKAVPRSPGGGRPGGPGGGRQPGGPGVGGGRPAGGDGAANE